MRGGQPDGSVLPVIQWLRIGAAAAGMAAALAATPGTAAADEAGSTASSGSAGDAGRTTAAVDRTAGPTPSPASRSRRPGAPASVNRVTPARPAATVAGSRVRNQVVRLNTDPAAAQLNRSVGTPGAALNVAPSTSATAKATAANPLSDVAAFFGLPAEKSSAGTIGGVGLYVGLQLRNIVSPQTATIDATSAVTGLFREILRRDPLPEELQSYSQTFATWGLNAVVAGVYSSSEFHQQELQGYYTQMLGRAPTDAELAVGTFQLAWGIPPGFIVAGIAASREFYEYSDQSSGVTGGQTVGTPAVAVPRVEPNPTATSFVNLLYRSLLGQAPDPVAAQTYVQELGNAGPLARALVAAQFITSDAYRAVLVKDIYQVVLGQNVATTGYSVQQYVDNWFLGGMLQGTTTQFLAGSANIARMSAVGGLVPLPDLASAQLLQQILLAAYSVDANGFVQLLKQALKQTEVLDQDGKLVPAACQTDCASAEALRKLIQSGGQTRGIPNSSIVINPADYSAIEEPSAFFNTSALRPTQDDIDMDNSIKYPLQHADTLATVLKGGDITVETGRIMTADNGRYILDGHHRWSSVFVMNPDTRIASIDIGYVPNAQDGLKEVQLAIAAQDGYLPYKTVQGQNLFKVTEQTFKDTVVQYINAGSDPAAVMAAFATYKGLTTMEQIQNYLWANVLQMRDNNIFVDGATPRFYMPQPLGNDYSPYLDYMSGQILSYSLPVVSYLG